MFYKRARIIRSRCHCEYENWKQIFSHQVNRRTMRERIAAARMISTLVSSPCWCSGQGPLQYNLSEIWAKKGLIHRKWLSTMPIWPNWPHFWNIMCSVCIVILRFSESAHFKTVPCSLKQKTRRRSTRPAIWGIAAATSIPSPIPAIMNIKAETLPHASMSVSYLVSGYSAWLVASPLSPPISLLRPPLWLPLEDSLDRKHLGQINNALLKIVGVVLTYLRMLMSRESSQRQVIPSSYGEHKWTISNGWTISHFQQTQKYHRAT